jgi:hypothetical protein
MRKSMVMKELTQKAEELNNDIFQHYSFWVNSSDELDASPMFVF